ncbi:hypothetical protein [Nesterenkonia halobia]|uniref:Uncharacterized protein n=1 Tax=Nesterenkonia halobia TaxID=37922 RepID=A0ABP6RLP2_9MICC
MPARRWPRAVRALYLWGPAVLLGGGVAVMSLAPAPSSTAAAEHEQPAGESAAQDSAARAQRSASPLRRAVAGLVAGAVVGGTAYGVARFSLWADDAAERGLQRLGVPRPRAAMAIMSGLGIAATAAAEGRAEVRTEADQLSSAVS